MISIKKHFRLIGLLMIPVAGFLCGCKKYLEKKSNASLAVPVTIADLQALMDNTGNFNSSNSVSGMEVSSDDFYLIDEDLAAVYEESDRRLYSWENDYVFNLAGNGNDWDSAYSVIYTCNTVLEAADKLPVETVGRNDLRGQALTMRAARFLDLLLEFAPAYDDRTASLDAGIVLRKTTDFNERSMRSSVAAGYAQIISDLHTAIPPLPVQPLSRTRASRPAAYGLLARVYLSMHNYVQAHAYADSCLMLHDRLLDYNTLVASDPYPIKNMHDEVIYFKAAALGEPLFNSVAKISPELIKSYEEYDLRKDVLFIKNTDESFGFRGYYTGGPSLFTGIATDEVLLTRAECAIRLGRMEDGMADLNRLLRYRYETGKFMPLTAFNRQQALDRVLQERRKELPMRTLRWMDVKRLNRKGNQIILSRAIGGEERKLLPNDLRYALPIPEDVIDRSGIPQNPR